MTAWSANVSSSLVWLSVNGRTDWRASNHGSDCNPLTQKRDYEGSPIAVGLQRSDGTLELVRGGCEVRHVNSSAVDYGSCGHPAAIQQDSVFPDHRRRRGSGHGDETEAFTVEAIAPSTLRIAELGRPEYQGIHCSLEIRWRTGDDPQHFSRRSLLFQRFGQRWAEAPDLTA